jgi:hypothetical protein
MGKVLGYVATTTSSTIVRRPRGAVTKEALKKLADFLRMPKAHRSSAIKSIHIYGGAKRSAKRKTKQPGKRK